MTIRAVKSIIPQSAKEKIKLVLSGEAFWALAASLLPSWFASQYRRSKFRAVYREKKWGRGDGAEFYSGAGSRGEAVTEYVSRMANLIGEHSSSDEVITVVDMGCGDFTVGRELTDRIKAIKYIGCDIVPELLDHNKRIFSNERITFKELDIVHDDLPKGDICLVRQVLQHLPNEDIQRVLAKLGTYKDVFITGSYPIIEEGPINPDKAVGADTRFDWRTGRGRGVELDKSPYNKRIEEVCRARSSLCEVIVTYRVHCRPVA